ncbi:hypothetical protein ACIBTV_27555 [Micromonospora sp. NPDC049366]|uniref:hypothetical protein n=1 Tax=Micromonospora sp. NPDC049366 TaxID=3364271 RepID=UPI00379D9993
MTDTTTTTETAAGTWTALIVHEGWVLADLADLDASDEVNVTIVRGSALPDAEGHMAGTYRPADVAFTAEDVYVDGEGDPDAAAPAVYERAKAMAAGLNAAAAGAAIRDTARAAAHAALYYVEHEGWYARDSNSHIHLPEVCADAAVAGLTRAGLLPDLDLTPAQPAQPATTEPGQDAS